MHYLSTSQMPTGLCCKHYLIISELTEINVFSIIPV